ERPGDADTLALTTGELVGTAVGLVLHADLGEQALRVARVLEPTERQRQLDLVAAGQGGDEVAGLEDETDPLTADPGELPWRGSREVDVTQADAARGGRREGASHGEQARLAGSRRSDDGDDLARLDLQGDLVEGDHGVVAVSVQQGDVGQGQGAHRLPPSAVRGSTRVIRTTAIAAPTRPSTSN